MKRINSRAKGARIERDAAAFLNLYLMPDGRSPNAKRMARNGLHAADLYHECERLHFEVKGDESIDVGTQALRDAITQADDTAAPECDPIVLWKRKGRAWRISRGGEDIATETYDADEYLTMELGWKLKEAT